MQQINIYTTTTCPVCHEAMEYFDEKSIPYTEHNVSNDPEARKELMKKGFRAVPVIMVGDKTLVGFDKEEVEAALQE